MLRPTYFERRTCNAFIDQLRDSTAQIAAQPGFAEAIEKAKNLIISGAPGNLIAGITLTELDAKDIKALRQQLATTPDPATYTQLDVRRSIASEIELLPGELEEVQRKKLVTFLSQRLFQTTNIISQLRQESGYNDLLRKIIDISDEQIEAAFLAEVLPTIESAILEMLLTKTT